MARDLTADVARHDDATSDQHERDKREKKARELTEYTAGPALVRRAGSGIVEGFTSPVAGFCFRMENGKPARQADADAYTSEAIKMAKERAHYFRLREREDGSTRKENGKYKTGAVSLLITLAPWAVPTVGRLKPEARDNIMMHLASVQAAKIKEVSGRETWGGAVHWDTAIPHANLHIPKTAPAGQDGKPGMAHAKSRFLTAGSWTTGADRITRKFPGLLAPQQAELLADNLGRKDVAHLVDVQSSRATDAALEEWIKQAGLWAAYEKDCEEYERRKRKEMAAEKHRRLMQASLSHFHTSGIWPLTLSAMRLNMWRMLPREIRGPIALAIRAQQFIKQPVKSALKMAMELPALEPRTRLKEMAGPGMQ